MKKKNKKPEKEPRIGMTTEEALLMFGHPLDIFESVSQPLGFLMKQEQWGYKNLDLSFMNGKLIRYARDRNLSKKP